MRILQYIILSMACGLILGEAQAVNDIQTDFAALTTQLAQLEQLVKATEPTPTWSFNLTSLREKLKQEVDNKNLEEPRDEEVDKIPQALVPVDELMKAAREFAAMTKQLHADTTQWLTTPPPPALYDLDVDMFVPFVQKLVVPEGAEIAFWGDTHGSASSVVRTLRYLASAGKEYLDENFNITKPNFYMVFLGDFTDRGRYCIELWYVLLRLALANPGKVILLRGNHEDRDMNAIDPQDTYKQAYAEEHVFEGEFLTRYERKIPDENIRRTLFELFTTIYQMLPLALFVTVETGNHAIHCSHGGFEFGYNAKNLLTSKQARFERLTTFNRQEIVAQLPIEDATRAFIDTILRDNPETRLLQAKPDGTFYDAQFNELGFVWYDFLAHDDDVSAPHKPFNWVEYDEGRGFVYGQDIARAYLTFNSTPSVTLAAFFRAHQHNSSMDPELWDSKGFFALWGKTVFTLLSAPQAFLGFAYDSCVIARTAKTFDRWTFTHIRGDERGFVRKEVSFAQ